MNASMQRPILDKLLNNRIGKSSAYDQQSRLSSTFIPSIEVIFSLLAVALSHWAESWTTIGIYYYYYYYYCKGIGLGGSLSTWMLGPKPKSRTKKREMLLKEPTLTNDKVSLDRTSTRRHAKDECYLGRIKPRFEPVACRLERRSRKFCKHR